MNAMPQPPSVPSAARIELECGHRLPVAWENGPAVVAAVVLRHQSDCGGDLPFALALEPVALPWPLRGREGP